MRGGGPCGRPRWGSAACGTTSVTLAPGMHHLPRTADPQRGRPHGPPPHIHVLPRPYGWHASFPKNLSVQAGEEAAHVAARGGVQPHGTHAHPSAGGHMGPIPSALHGEVFCLAPTRGLVMLSAAKNLWGTRILRCAQHDRAEYGCNGKIFIAIYLSILYNGGARRTGSRKVQEAPKRRCSRGQPRRT